jgi:competence protein ComEC
MATRKSKKRLKRILAVAFVLICIVMALNEASPKPFLPQWDSWFQAADMGAEAMPAGKLQVTVLDVGNADAILLQSGDAAMLIDAGEQGDGDDVVSLLRQKGITKLQYIIATHADSDHIGGMKTVLEGVGVENYVMAFMPKGYTPTTKTYQNVLLTIEKKEIPLTVAKVGHTFALGEATVEILGPAGEFTNNNDQSVVCKVTFGEKKFLFMGDAEQNAEQGILQTGANLQADVLKVGHHGSESGTTVEFLNQVKPKVAVITSGKGNRYGHPHSDCLERLHKVGAEVYRSDISGTITMVCDGKDIFVTTEKGAAKG